MPVIPAPRDVAPACVDESIAADVQRHRGEIADIVQGRDDRLLAIVGPCSVHDAQATHEYAARLRQIAIAHERDLLIVLRVYVEKPRSRHGWSGFALDPDLDGTNSIAEGLAESKRLMATVAACGLPVACEFVDPNVAAYLSDYVSWAAIGARTVESPLHRRLASDLSMPVGMKNRTDGAIGPAIDAVAVAHQPQPMVSIGADGHLHAYQSSGNPDAHVVLRGGDHGPNFSAPYVTNATQMASELAVSPRLVIDCSHGNSGKDHRRQRFAVQSVAEQLAGGETAIAGVMLESFLEPGKQTLGGSLTYGVSVTDACIDLPETAELADHLAATVAARRSRFGVLAGKAQ